MILFFRIVQASSVFIQFTALLWIIPKAKTTNLVRLKWLFIGLYILYLVFGLFFSLWIKFVGSKPMVLRRTFYLAIFRINTQRWPFQTHFYDYNLIVCLSFFASIFFMAFSMFTDGITSHFTLPLIRWHHINHYNTIFFVYTQ